MTTCDRIKDVVDELEAEREDLANKLQEVHQKYQATMQALRVFVAVETCPVSDNCAGSFVSGAYWGWGQARNRVQELLNLTKPTL